MAGEALRLAIELHDQPMLRHALRHRALPEGMEELIGLTGGAPGRVAGPADTLGLPAGLVVEAARFFVQEVLLYSGADAYRVLGVSRDADDPRIKRHYRALQHWLHPDRLSNSPESIYSAQVNRAWDLLRTPARREAFDAATSAADTGTAGAADGATGSHIQRWERVDYTGTKFWQPQILASIGLLGLCVGLLWLALRDSPVPTFPDALDWTRKAVDEAGQPPIENGESSQIAQTVPVESVANAPAFTRTLQPADPPAMGAAPPSDPAPAPTRDQLSVVTSIDHEVKQHAPLEPVRKLAATKPAVAPELHRAPEAVTVQNLHAVSPEWLLARHRAAREQSARLLNFLTRRNASVPPIWRSAPALDSAQAVQQQLTHNTVVRRPKIDHSKAHWTLGEDVAVLAIPVSPADRSTAPQRLQVNLVWHKDAWWIDGVTLGDVP